MNAAFDPHLIDLPADVGAVVDALAARGGRALLVGGLVRDALLGIDADKDIDLEVFGLPEEAIAEVLGRFGRVHEVGKSFGVFKLRLESASELDVSLPRRESKRGRGHRGFDIESDPSLSPREAATRRDYTVNAMSWDPRTGEVLDFFDGRGDLRRRVLRHTSPRFAEDPLRVLRGFQLAARLDFTIDPATAVFASPLAAEYDTLAPERIWGEWEKWASRGRRPSAGIDVLKRTGWLSLYPEIAALEGCPQDPEWHPEGDVYTHTLLVLDAAARIAARDALSSADRTVLVLAALCHDLGKPETTIIENGRVRSPGHADRGSTLESLLARLAAPERISRRVLALSRFHLAHLGFEGSKRHVRRLARALELEGETIPMLARLVEADHDARPPLPGGLPASMRLMLDVAHEVDVENAAPRPLLQGRHLLELGCAPGPRMGELLTAAYEAQLDGHFGDLDGALTWARERLS